MFFTTSIAIPLLIILILLFIFLLIRFFYKPVYNRIHAEPRISAQKAVMAFSVGELIDIYNLIHDLYQELRKPFFIRFFKYPQPSPGYLDIINKCTERLELLTMYAEERKHRE